MARLGVFVVFVLAGIVPILANPAETAILPPELPWAGKSRGLALAPDHEWATPCERSGLERTPRYDETVAWLRKLAAATRQVRLVSLGKSAEGREIWMVVASREGASDPAALRKNGRPTLFVQAGIHSGEIDGKDAGMMLLRDMTVLGKKKELLDAANLLFVPILSVDAHERFSRFSRLNQRGPVESGWRTNGRNLNLNRDYTKLETEEMQALVAAILSWQPDLYVDVHVTDGADYQYDVTWGYNGCNGWSPRIAHWLNEFLSPALSQDLAKMGHVPGPLAFGANNRDMTGGNVIWTASPRFSNGWGDARHLPTALIETHSLKAYPQRVLGTYVWLETALRTLGRESASLREAAAEDRRALPAEIPLAWQVDPAAKAPLQSFRGVRSVLEPSPITGTLQVRWTGEPVEVEIPHVDWATPSVSVVRPESYFIPAAWYPIADKLRRQGIGVQQSDAATNVEVEMYRLPEAAIDLVESPFEGRTLYLPGKPVIERRTLEFPAGSFRVDTAQPLGTLAVLLLEPQSPDSFFQWGYFAEVLQRAEYAESYVLEPMARAMLEADPGLRAEFEARLLSDTKFAGDAAARLRFFYEKTPFFDTEYRLYPVARLLSGSGPD